VDRPPSLRVMRPRSSTREVVVPSERVGWLLQEDTKSSFFFGLVAAVQTVRTVVSTQVIAASREVEEMWRLLNELWRGVDGRQANRGVTQKFRTLTLGSHLLSTELSPGCGDTALLSEMCRLTADEPAV
jgi:hypothetical protein